MTQVIPETQPDFDRTRLIERPDGFYWKEKGEPREYGPFASLLEAVQSMQAADGAPMPTKHTSSPFSARAAAIVIISVAL